MARKATLDELPKPPMGRSGWPWTEGPAASFGDGTTWPRVSIVTPSFNQAGFIEETIRSVLLQGYPDLQYLVVDGGSTDGTQGVLEAYSPWIDFWVSEPDRGQSHAINKGLSRCDGTWFNWLNSDDYLLPGALHALAGASRAATRPIVSGVTRNVGAPGLAPSYSARADAAWPACLFNLGVNQPGSLIRMSSVRAVGPLNESLSLCMDLELWLRVCSVHGPDPVEQVAEHVAAYRYHPGSKTCSGRDVFALEECRVLTALAGKLGGLPEAVPEDLRGSAPAGSRDSAVARALLDRLVVSDSLLYRALVLSRGGHKGAREPFLAALSGLGPEIGRLFPEEPPREVEARAILRALQSARTLDPAMTLRAFAAAPGAAMAADLLRSARNALGGGRK